MLNCLVSVGNKKSANLCDAIRCRDWFNVEFSIDREHEHEQQKLNSKWLRHNNEVKKSGQQSLIYVGGNQTSVYVVDNKNPISCYWIELRRMFILTTQYAIHINFIVNGCVSKKLNGTQDVNIGRKRVCLALKTHSSVSSFKMAAKMNISCEI